MRVLWTSLVIGALLLPANASSKLTEMERQTLIRDLTAEFGVARVLIPRSKKPLELAPDGSFVDPEQWGGALQEFGPAARLGDMVQITKVEFKGQKLVLEINHGINGGAKWWHRVQVSGGANTGSNRGTTLGQAGHAPGGTTLAVLFDKEIPNSPAEEFLKMLKPVLDFDERSASEVYLDTLEPEQRAAVEKGEVLEGMDRDMTLLAKGRPDRKVRDFKDGVETEDWIYGKPPGDIVFVTFEDGKVIAVKHEHANLGGQVRKVEPIKP
ncbi:MAG: hypothetical protein GC160_11040 [Acidobacteria bacterium]|nr:hypothetical protein [Acidobacteriota bacterium]